MGSIIGAVGSAIGAQQQAKAAKEAAQIQAAASDRAGERALTGYNYLTSGAGAVPMQNYIKSGQAALGNQGTTQNLMMDLLGISDYGNSTGRVSGQYAQQAAPTTQGGPQQSVQPGNIYGPTKNAFGSFLG